MVEYKTPADQIFNFVNVLLLTFLTLITLYPCAYVLFASVSDHVQLYNGSKLLLYPRGFSLTSYKVVLENQMIWRSYLNTIIYAITGTALSVFLTIIGGYVLSRTYLPGRRAVMLMLTITMFFGGGLIPTYLVVRSLGMLDSIWALILPSAVGTYNLILVKTYFLSMPAGLEEAARIDGANDWTILWRIMAPLAMPVIAVITLYCIVGSWNSYIPPTIYLRTRSLFPLQVILREILLSGDTSSMNMSTGVSGGFSDFEAYSEAVKFATIVVSTVPILCLYPVLQKYFVKGVMLGAIKG